jgi:hypothetical protein
MLRPTALAMLMCWASAVQAQESINLACVFEYSIEADGSQRVRFSHLGRLIGNAVPVRLGEIIAETFVRHVGNVGQV